MESPVEPREELADPDGSGTDKQFGPRGTTG